jgi:hypothetical protein
MALQLTVPEAELAHAAREAAFRAGTAGVAAGVQAIIGLLTVDERHLAAMLFANGVSYRRAAAALGWSDSDPLAHVVALAIDALDEDSRAFAVDLLIRGHSERAIARARGLTRRVAQQRADAIRGWARSLLIVDPPPPRCARHDADPDFADDDDDNDDQ